MTTDPFAPARRAIWTGALAALAGSLLAVLGIGGTGWILIVPGVLLFVIGVLRLLRGSWTIALERQRQALLRAGVQGTATVISSHQVATRFAHPIYEMELTVTAPSMDETKLKKRAAIPPQYAGEVSAGAELPVRVHEDSTAIFAVDWDAL